MFSENRIRKFDFHFLVAGFNSQFFFKIVAYERDASGSCFPVQIFPETIGPHVPVNHINMHMGISLFEFQGTLDGLGAAYFGTEGSFRNTGAVALEKNGGAESIKPDVPLVKPLL